MSTAVARHSEQNCLVRFSFLLQDRLETGFEKIGGFVARYPWPVMLLSIIVTAGLSGGIVLQKSESRTEKLWVPQNSQALTEQDWVRQTFGFGGRTGYILARPKDNGNALTGTVLGELLKAHKELLKTRAQSETSTDKFPFIYSYEDNTNTTTPHTESICSRRAGLCYTSTIFDVLGSYDVATVSAMNQSYILSRVNNPANYAKTFSVGPAMVTAFNITRSDIFGGLSTTPPGGFGTITSTAIVRSVYRMDSRVINVNNDFQDPSRESWERQAEKDINAPSYASSVDVVSWFGQTFSDEFSGAVGGDLALFGIGAALLIGYMTGALGKRDYVHSMFGVSIVAVICVGLSIGASYGLSAICGVFVTPLTNTLPFLILGLGVDDAFIIAGEFQNIGATHPELDTQERMRETMKHAGVSILITSVTDVTAFLIGSSTVLPALSAFCIYAALGVVFVFLMNVTLFPAALVIDAERTLANRMDCLCCCKLEQEHPIAPEIGEELPYCLCLHKIPQNATRLVCKAMAEKLMIVWMRVACGAIAVGLLAFAIVGATRLTQNFKIEWFLPDDSPLQKYYSWNEQYFTNDLPVFGYTRQLDYSSTTVRTQMGDIKNLFSTASYLNGRVLDWHSSFLGWAARNATARPTSTSSEFYTSLNSYISSDEGKRFAGFIRFVNPSQPSQGVKGAYVFGFYKQSEIPNADKQVAAMTNIRNDYKKIMPISEGFPFSFTFAFWEQFAVIQEEMWRNIALAVVSVFLITTTLIPKLLASLLVLLAVCLSIADLLGLMYWWGLTIDAVTVVYLVIAIGLSVDYSAHIGEAFMLSRKKTREERVIDTMYRMGASVFNGAFSTFLAVLVMAFAKTYIFRVFFQQFFLVTLFGCWHGLIILPILLATCGPKTTLSHDGENETNSRPSIVGFHMKKATGYGDEEDVEMVNTSSAPPIGSEATEGEGTTTMGETTETGPTRTI